MIPYAPPPQKEINNEDAHTDSDREEPAQIVKPQVEENKKTMAPPAPVQPPANMIASPTIADPSYDPAKEFLVLLLSPTTPIAKKKELMMLYF